MAKKAASSIPYTRGQLYKLGPQLTYSGRNLDEISFPLGGIGTGSIGLGGWGQLRDWEIMNRPAKGCIFADGFFALKARTKKGSVTKVLQGPVGGSFVDGRPRVERIARRGAPAFQQRRRSRASSPSPRSR